LATSRKLDLLRRFFDVKLSSPFVGLIIVATVTKSTENECRCFVQRDDTVETVDKFCYVSQTAIKGHSMLGARSCVTTWTVTCIWWLKAPPCPVKLGRFHFCNILCFCRPILTIISPLHLELISAHVMTMQK